MKTMSKTPEEMPDNATDLPVGDVCAVCLQSRGVHPRGSGGGVCADLRAAGNHPVG